MIRNGILTEDDPVELLEGYMVTKMPRSPEHDFALSAISNRMHRLVPSSYTIRGQCAATIQESEPEPDLIFARGDEARYRSNHPGPNDTALVIEVAASSLTRDRTDKARIYARAAIPVYWVVNVTERVIEVYTQPSGHTSAPAYGKRDDYPVGTSVPVVLDGQVIGTIVVAEVMS
jgi:Uma2 family endonuclease